MGRFPSRVVQSAVGRHLVAVGDLPAGTVVGRFEGPVVDPGDVPADAIRHALVLEVDRWLVPTTDARFADHACDPTCRLDDDLRVVTIRPVPDGGRLTFRYNVVRPGEDPGPWDERWSFACTCGAAACQGAVDGYVVEPHDGGPG